MQKPHHRTGSPCVGQLFQNYDDEDIERFGANYLTTRSYKPFLIIYCFKEDSARVLVDPFSSPSNHVAGVVVVAVVVVVVVVAAAVVIVDGEGQ
ncbi:unnamed protein product [Gongylonema pulchrum]|uniref:Ubiquitinyl hydrolase 1 n=1 Tax=Gongylonema pulchrum TaxID=637853 RepID=A0A183EPL8_9BILA|nr:unnamed protein product [Gongylonema pulchrum]